jgi:hypothetical protein
MFEQFLPNKNKILQCHTVFCGVLGGANSAQLNTARFSNLHHAARGSRGRRHGLPGPDVYMDSLPVPFDRQAWTAPDCLRAGPFG